MSSKQTAASDGRDGGTIRDGQRGRSILITAGPTHEPIDSVRYIGNRSSGRLGIALADEAAGRGWRVRLLLGPVCRMPSDTRVSVERFRTCAELEALLAQDAPRCDVLVMAAAVADYRAKVTAADLAGKRRRTAGGMTLELEATPDLLAQVSRSRRAGQMLVGFALEPRDELLASARSKLDRKGVDLIVGNPLESMDSDMTEAVVVSWDGIERRTPGRMPKNAFAGWLLDVIESGPKPRSV